MNDREDCEQEANEDEFSPTSTDVEELKRKLKAPDRGKFDRELERIHTSIREKEATFRALQTTRSQGMPSSTLDYKDRDTLMTELRGFKAEREKEIETRKKIDQELRGVNSLVQQKNDTCAKLQAGLKYKTEAKADESIRRLEHQMRVQQLKLREEKRLVSEIDALKRSKKLIHEFDALKHEISQLRDKQYSLRAHRDNCIRTIARLKSKEEEIKTTLDKQRHKDVEAKQQQRGYNTEKTALKKDIDELYTQKRALISDFNKEKEEYSALLKDIRFQERQIRREVEVMKRIEQRHTQRMHHGSNVTEQSFVDATHERMLNVCDSLIKYLEGLTLNTKMGTDDSEPFHGKQPDLPGSDSNFTGGTFLKKKTDDDLEAMYGGGASKKGNRRGSRKGRRSNQKENVPKKLVLHPLVLDQFLSLTIAPPCTAIEIPKVLELLIEKKANLNTVIDIPDDIPDDMSRSLSSASSVTSSVENFPFLPSQQDSVSSLDSSEVKDDLHPDELEKSEDTVTISEQTQEEQQLLQQQQNSSIPQNCAENGALHLKEDNFFPNSTPSVNMGKESKVFNSRESNGNISSPAQVNARQECTEDSRESQKVRNPENCECGNEVDYNSREPEVLDLNNHGLKDDHLKVIPKDNLAQKPTTNSSIKCPS